MFRKLFEGIAAEWCRLTHGGGHVMRDPAGRVNWQCWRCGRWAQPVSNGDEYAMTQRDIEVADAMREVGRRIGH